MFFRIGSHKMGFNLEFFETSRLRNIVIFILNIVVLRMSGWNFTRVNIFNLRFLKVFVQSYNMASAVLSLVTLNIDGVVRLSFDK